MRRQEIPGWFDLGVEKSLARIIEQNEIRTVIEIGSFLGASAAFFAERCDVVCCIDPFVVWDDFKSDPRYAEEFKGLREDFYPQFWGYMNEVGASGKIMPVRLSSEMAFYVLPALRADMVYIDGAHDEVSVCRDIMMWKTRANKVLCGDDYDENWPGVKRAVDESFSEVEIAGKLWVSKL